MQNRLIDAAGVMIAERTSGESASEVSVNRLLREQIDNNAEFSDFVDTWLSNWVGYVKETVFDVNMLQIDEHTVIVNNYNREMFDFFKSKNI